MVEYGTPAKGKVCRECDEGPCTPAGKDRVTDSNGQRVRCDTGYFQKEQMKKNGKPAHFPR